MRTMHKIGLAAALLASAAIGPVTVFAQDEDRPRHERPDRPDRPDRDQPDQNAQPNMGDRGDRGDRARSNMDRGDRHGPPADFRGQRPDRNFRSVPPGFRGDTSPRSQMRTRGGVQGQATFNGRTFNQFTASDRAMWRQGTWHHTRHNGKWGWWWYVNGFWFFYDRPFYPFPTFIGFYYDDYPYDYYWYWCDYPPGYYPYVRYCYGPWIPVPPQYY